MDIALVDGRSFASGDPVDAVVINTLMARRFFGDASSLGRRFRLSERAPWMTVIGVAADVTQSGPQARGNEMEFYQFFDTTTPTTYFSFIVRASQPAANVADREAKVVGNRSEDAGHQRIYDAAASA